MCGVNDFVSVKIRPIEGVPLPNPALSNPNSPFQTCVYEANEQYRLDKMVDWYILQTLKSRVDQCVYYHRNSPSIVECTQVTWAALIFHPQYWPSCF